jgi:hypothetical protein
MPNYATQRARSTRPEPAAPRNEKPDRWSIQALALEKELKPVAVSGQAAVAQRVVAGMISVPEAAALFLRWNANEQLEFAESLAAVGTPLLKNKVANEISRQANGSCLNQKAVALLSFRMRADDIVIEVLGDYSTVQSPSQIASRLSQSFSDRTLLTILAEAFGDKNAQSLCDTRRKQYVLDTVSSLLKKSIRAPTGQCPGDTRAD